MINSLIVKFRRWKQKRVMLAKFMAEHGHVIRSFQYSPEDGSKLCWNINVIERGPFDPMTGLGVPSIDVGIDSSSMDRHTNIYVYKYQPDEKKVYFRQTGMMRWLPLG